MKFSAIFTAALTFGAAVASPMLERRQDATTLASKIVTIQKKIATLNNTVVSLKQGDILTLAKALIIQQQSQDVLTAIGDATTSANKINGQLSDDDSGLVAAPVLDLLDPVQILLNNLVAKKPVFASAVFGFGDLSKTVLKSLQDQKAATVKLGAAIVPKLSDFYQSLAPGILDTLSGYFDTAIAAYQKCASGKVCLPPFPTITIPKALPKPTKKSS